MMKQLVSSLRKQWRPTQLLRVLSSSSTASASYPSSSPAEKANLYSRISPVGNPEVSIVPILDQWLQEGRSVGRNELLSLVRRLHSSRRYSHALQVSEWGEKLYGDMSYLEISFRLGLISRVQGLELAQKYFDSLSPGLRTPHVYYSLLHSYVRARSLEKAEDLMVKLKELGLAQGSFPYNMMLRLYSELGMHEKLDPIMEELEEKGIWPNRQSCYIRLNAYAAASDVKGMEMFLGRMERDPLCTMDCTAYWIAANGYVKVGAINKCVAMLKRVERLATGKEKKRAYEFLLTIYGRAKKKDEVYRIWKIYKSSWKVFNRGYINMVSSLVKTGDLEGAENTVEEFHDSEMREYDYRVIHSLISAYGRKGDFERAEALVSRAMKRGGEPPTSVWDILATGYCIHDRMDEAVVTFKKALLADRQGRKRNNQTLSKCLHYLKQKGDLKELEELTTMVRDHAHHSETLLLDALEKGSELPDPGDQIEEDDAEIEDIISPFQKDGLHS